MADLISKSLFPGWKNVFSPNVHADYIRDVYGEEGYSKDVRNYLIEVQRYVDSRFGGMKNDANLYIHHILPARGYKLALDELVDTYVERALSKIFSLLLNDYQDDGTITDATIGSALFYLGALTHTVQDYKHREDNHPLPDGTPITNREHFWPYGRQFITDFWPTEKQAAKAKERTRNLVKEFENRLDQFAGKENKEQILFRMKNWKKPPAKEFSTLFPSAGEIATVIVPAEITN